MVINFFAPSLSGLENILPPPAEGEAAFLRSAFADPAEPDIPVPSPAARLQCIRHTEHPETASKIKR